MSAWATAASHQIRGSRKSIADISIFIKNIKIIMKQFVIVLIAALCSATMAHGAHIRNPDKLAAEADKLLQSAFEYGPLQDDTVMVDAISNNSDSE